MALRPLTVCTALAALAAGIGTAAPASADTQAFLEYLVPRYTSMTPAQLIAAGNRACALLAQTHSSAATVSTMTTVDRLGTPEAIDIVSKAVVYLGC